MVKEITVKNSVTSASHVISMHGGKFILDEIDWGTPPVSPTTFRVPGQVGESLLGITVGTRPVMIYGYVVSNMTLEEIKAAGTWENFMNEQERRIESYKAELNKLISVYQDVEIQVGQYKLYGKPDSVVKYSNTYEENNEVMCRFQISIVCYDPMFHGQSKTASLAAVKGMFHFPLILTEDTTDEHVVFGEIMRRQSISIENNGDSEAGCIITIRARGGSVVDPQVYNVNTGEYIGFQGVTLESGDYIRIDTNTGSQSVVKHSIETGQDISIVGNMTDGSTFLKIQQGVGLYAYSVDEDYINNIEINVTFIEKVFVIPEM